MWDKHGTARPTAERPDSEDSAKSSHQDGTHFVITQPTIVNLTTF